MPILIYYPQLHNKPIRENARQAQFQQNDQTPIIFGSSLVHQRFRFFTVASPTQFHHFEGVELSLSRCSCVLPTLWVISYVPHAPDSDIKKMIQQINCHYEAYITEVYETVSIQVGDSRVHVTTYLSSDVLG